MRIRVLEQAESKLNCQDAQHSVINNALRNTAFSHELFQIFDIAQTEHVHVNAGVDGQSSSVFAVLRNTLMYKLGNGIPIRDDETGKSEFIFEDIRQQMMVCGNRCSVVFVKRRHDSKRPGIYAAFKGRKIGVSQSVFTNLHTFVVATAFCRAISYIMLAASGNAALLGRVAALEALYSKRNGFIAVIRIIIMNLCILFRCSIL